MENESMYVVWSPAMGPPKVRHPSQEQALAEARRLCELNQGHEYFVLRAVQSVTYRTDPYVTKCYSRKG